jgi:hypothetical protein
MCGYLVYISYSTLVISQLTAVKPKLPFESIEELALRKDYKLIVKNDVGLLADIEVSFHCDYNVMHLIVVVK